MNKYKVAVYTICKDEEQFVSRFMACLKGEADAVYVTDTGSSDNTVKLLREEGAIVNEIVMKPWRFDIPRNISMQVIPKDFDIIVCIDLDEVLTPGWRAAIERAWTPQTTRLRYPYVWNTLPDGKPGTTFFYDKITCRNGYRWVKPVHEILEYVGEEVQTYCHDFTLSHFPDHTKSRGSYLPLLEQGCREAPDDDRNSHYLGREYMYYNMHDKAIVELQRHLSLPSAKWDAERSASMRYIARCYLAKSEVKLAIVWALKACAEAPGEREPWVELGKVYYACQNWPGLYYAMKQALAIVEKPMSYICDADAWNHAPHDYLSIAAFDLGLYKEAVEHCEQAVIMEPTDVRLQTNLHMMKAKI